MLHEVFQKNTHEASLQAYLMKTSFELINDGLGVTVLTHETRIHTNRNESRPLRRQFSSAYRGTAARSLTPSQSARAKGEEIG